jgi:hypothetical protein
MKNKSNISDKQLRKLIVSPVFKSIISEDNDIEIEKLSSFEKLSIDEIDGIKINAEYWMKNYSTYDVTYSSQFDYEVNPIQVFGIRGLYLVKVADVDGEFFDTKKEAIAYADEAIKNFFVDFV